MIRLLLPTLLAAPLFAAEPWLLSADEIAALAAQTPAALAEPITTVVDGETLPGGDPHDYVSYARYWWPDPTQTDGLPFIRHDGRHNHEQVKRGDRLRLTVLSETVTALAAAWHLHQDEAAARRAGTWLRAWFLDEATRMNPNLNYGQVRLGHNRNRGNATGVLDSRDFALVIDAVRLLEDSPALTAADHTGLQAWFVTYLDWLLTSPNGRGERAATNNHGTWYFAQAISVARFAGRDDIAFTLCAEARALIDHQVAADGAQPEEIARADGLSYSQFNLEAWLRVVRAAAGLDVDLWSYTAPNGASLPRAVEFLRPYNTAPETWPHRQQHALKPGFLDALLAQAESLSSSHVLPLQTPR